MGASPLFPLFIVLFFLGIASLGRNQLELTQAPTISVANTTLQAATFLKYRSVVTAYAQAHPGWTGTVPASYLSSQGVSAAAQGQISHQVVASAAGRQLIAYAALAGTGYEVYRQAQGDAAIGVVANGQFQSFNPGAPVALPIAVPNGDVVSFMEVGT